MKRLLISLSILLFAGLVFSSCSSNEDTETKTATLSEGSNSEQVNTPLNFSPGFAVLEISGIDNNSDFPFVDFTFMENGVKKSLSEVINGRTAFINFWGTWCPPCRKEIPDIIEIAAENSNVVVIGIALERPRDLASRKKGVEEYGSNKNLNYINFVINPSIEQELITAYGGINAVPTTYILTPEGQVHEKIVGMRSKSEFMTSINKITNKGA